MENPGAVDAAGKALFLISGIVCGALSLYLWNVAIFLAWLYGLIVFAVLSIVIVAIWAITVWPLVILTAQFLNMIGKEDKTSKLGKHP